MKFVELFAGIGGFSLGFERAGMECVGHCEIEPYAQKVLLKHWPNVPLYPDIKKLKGNEYGKFEVLCGGFPCQDLSCAGKQKGITGKRSGLFDEIIRLAGIYRPKYIVLENVSNLIIRPDWFGYIVGRITEIGYNAEWEIISAADIGAPHLRERIWIVAYTTGDGNRKFKKSHRGKDTARQEGTEFFDQFRESCRKKIWKTEPEMGRMADGIPDRMDRLKCLGNALIPQISEYIGRLLMEIEGS